MNKEKAYNLLKKTIKHFSDIPEELIQELFNICKLVKIKKKQFFLMEGDIPLNVGFNLNGIFRLFYIDDNGTDHTKGFSTKGKFIISYSALVQKRPSYFNIEAIVDTDILLFKYSEWQNIINENKEWYPFLYKLVESVYIMKEMREKSFLMDDAKTRYLNFKKEYPELENKIKLYHIASFLGITPEALSRIRKKIKLT